MKQIILNSPKQFKVGVEKAKDIGIRGDFENIVICGLGGSAMPGILLQDAFSEDLKIPVFIHRSYALPAVALAKVGLASKSLIVCISFSGNTEETLSSYKEAEEKGFSVIALTTGGKLAEMAQQNSLPYCLIPNDCLQPRFGTGYLFSALIKILINSGLLDQKVENKILSLKESLRPATFEKKGQELAKKLMGKTPVVYSSNNYKSIARISKIKFNENSKIMAFWNYFPELNHNEMAGFTKAKSKKQKANSFYAIILKDTTENPKIIKRMELTAELIKEAGADVEIIEMPGKTRLEKMFNTLLIFDWTSYYLALANNIDPISVPIVEDFKKRLVN